MMSAKLKWLKSSRLPKSGVVTFTFGRRLTSRLARLAGSANSGSAGSDGPTVTIVLPEANDVLTTSRSCWTLPTVNRSVTPSGSLPVKSPSTWNSVSLSLA